MEVALYHPEVGYYRRHPHPAGRAGDYYTAEQVQPVFGRLLSAHFQQLAKDLHARHEPLSIVELGAGAASMADYFPALSYVAIELASGSFPERFDGIVFSNEFLDALPVDLIRTSISGPAPLLVDFDAGRFKWAADANPDTSGPIRETQSCRLEWIHRIDRHLEDGFVVTIDYGYTRSEQSRFPHGTCLAYRNHQVVDNVLDCPGEQDITAHVDFTALQEEGERLGWTTIRYESLKEMLLRIGEADGFAKALEGRNEGERLRHRLQLKTLLFGMGETFRVLTQRKHRAK